MKEQRGIRNETREKYSDAITLYVETGLSIKQICEQTGVGFYAFSSYLSTHHRDLILKRHNLTEFKNVKLRGKKGQTTAAHYKYKDAIDPILELLVQQGKGLELNTGSFRYGLRQPHPCTDVLRRYHELGGEIITVGTDAHKPQDVGSYLDLASEILQLCGFKYYTIYEKRSPEYHKL